MVMVGTSVAVSTLIGDSPLFAVQAVRYLLAAGLLLALARLTGARLHRPHGREWWWLTGVAATGLVLFNVALVRGVEHAEPAVIAVAVACVPVVLGIAGPLLAGGRPTARVLLAGAVVTAGCILVEGSGRADGVGIAWAAVALACEAGFTLLAMPVLARHGAWGVSLHSVWIGAALFTLLSIVTEGPTAVSALTGTDLFAIGYLAVVVTAAAFLCWYSAVEILGAGRAGLLTGIAPISAAFTGVLVGAALPGPLVWVGIGVVLAGLAVGLARGRSTAEPIVGATEPTPAV